jgi:hypothetical protein
MLNENDLWLLEEDIPTEEPSDLLVTMPEMRQWVDPDRPDEPLGLRSLLEYPEALSKAWRHGVFAERPSRIAKRQATVLRAA